MFHANGADFLTNKLLEKIEVLHSENKGEKISFEKFLSASQCTYSFSSRQAELKNCPYQRKSCLGLPKTTYNSNTRQKPPSLAFFW